MFQPRMKLWTHQAFFLHRIRLNRIHRLYGFWARAWLQRFLGAFGISCLLKYLGRSWVLFRSGLGHGDEQCRYTIYQQTAAISPIEWLWIKNNLPFQADEQASCDLGIERAWVPSFFNIEYLLNPGHHFVGAGIGRFIQVDNAVLQVLLEWSL